MHFCRSNTGLFPVGPVEPVACDAICDTGANGSSISERAAKAVMFEIRVVCEAILD